MILKELSVYHALYSKLGTHPQNMPNIYRCVLSHAFFTLDICYHTQIKNTPRMDIVCFNTLFSVGNAQPIYATFHRGGS